MWYAVAVLVSTILSAVLAPKPESAPPPAVGEIDAPVAEEGKPIPVLFGTRVIKSPNCVWWGDVLISAIKKKGGKK